MSAHRVVVVGGGFAGLQAVRGLRRAPVEVTLVDRQNYTLFQPLVYQVATGALSPAEIAPPLRRVLRRQRNARVVLAEVTGFDLDRREVVLDRLAERRRAPSCSATTRSSSPAARATRTSATTSGSAHAPELKSLAGALEIRSRILAAFEAAEVEPDPERRRSWLTFVVVGAGPTGVEMAGQIAELARDALRRDFRAVDTRTARVLLVEAADRVLPGFPAPLSRKAARALEQLGVTPLAGAHGRRRRRRLGRDPGARRRGRARRRPHRVWAAGRHRLRPRGRSSPPRPGSTSTAPGASRSAPDLTLPGHPEVLALGDMVRVQAPDGAIAPLPGPRAGRDPAGAVRGPRDPRPAPRPRAAPLPLPRQGEPRHDRPLAGRRRHEGRPRSPASPPGRSGSWSTSST